MKFFFHLVNKSALLQCLRWQYFKELKLWNKLQSLGNNCVILMEDFASHYSVYGPSTTNLSKLESAA